MVRIHPPKEQPNVLGLVCGKCKKRPRNKSVGEYLLCPTCMRGYSRCADCGGEAGARRSLAAHMALWGHGPDPK